MSMKGRAHHKILLASFAIALCLTQVRAQQFQDENPPPRIIRKAGGVLQGSASKRVEPTYPPLAIAAKVSGTVVVEVTIDEEGKVLTARALSGHPLLKESAVTAARGWTFSPTQLQGVPIKVIGTITFNFHLDESTSASNELDEFRQKVADNPNSPELVFELGQAYQKYGQHENAIEAFNRAIELKPDFAQAYCELGQAHHALGQDDEALEASQRAVAIDPAMESASDASLLIGRIFLKKGRFQEAIDSFKRTLTITSDSGDSESDDAHFGLLLAYVKTEDKQSALKEYEALQKRAWITPEALKPLKQLIDLMP